MSTIDRTVVGFTGATVALVGGGLVIAVPTASAAAQTFTATDFASLVSAIDSANANAGFTDTISIPAGTTIALGGGGLPGITESVVISGGAMATSIIDGNDYQIFYIANGAAAVTISNLTLSDGYTVGNGGAIYSSDGNLTLDTVTISSSGAGRNGGALAFYRDGNAGDIGDLVVRNSLFTGNSAAAAGGAIYVDGFYSPTDATSVTIVASTFSTNTAGGSGGAAAFVGVDVLSITETSFDDNYSRSGAGALQVRGGATCTIGGSDFDANTTYGAGGAMAIYGSYLDATISTSTVTDSEAGSGGGALKVNGLGSLTISDSTFIRSTAWRDGGAMYALEVSDGITIDTSTFAYNSSTYLNGGAIRTNSSITIRQSTFDANSAANDGGALHLFGGNSYTTVVIENSTLSNNRADESGGALWLSSSSNYASIIEQSTISGNVADADESGVGIGAAIVVRYATELTVTNSTIAGNTSYDSTGGVAVPYGSLTLHNTILADNTDAAGDNDLEVGANPAVGNHNLVEASTSTVTGTGNLTDIDPMLGALADNGGATRTMLPAADSPVVNAGDNGVQPFATDQRDAPRVHESTIDIGAVEQATPQPEIPLLPPTGSGSERGLVVATLVAAAGALLARGARGGTRTHTPSEGSGV